MKFNKLFIGLLGMMAIMLSACSSDDDYQRATVSGAQVYFPNTLGKTIETPNTASSFTVPVYRVNTAGQLTVPLNITMGEGSIYTPAAQQVTFADGSNTAELVFNYDPAKVVFGDYYDITVAIDGEGNATDYGLSTYAFKAGKTAWVDMDGTAMYREDCITTFFGVGNDIIELDIQKNVVTEGVYRLVNPYGEAYPYNEPGDWDDSKDYYLTVNASDPNYVYVEKSDTGMDWGYGMFSIQSLVSYYLSKGTDLATIKAEHPEYFGTLKGGVITMPAGSLLLSMADYKEGAWYPSNAGGKFAIALPGSRIADYSVEYTYLGRLTDASDNDFIRGKFKLGKDIYSVKYAMASADDDIDAVVAGIIDGSIEAPEMKRSEAEPFEVAMDGPSGKYYLVVVVFDESGEAVSTEAFEIKYKSSKDTAETWTPLYVGTYTTPFFTDENDNPWSQEGTLYVSDSDNTRYRISPFIDNEGDGLVFTWTEDNVITFDEVETAYEHPSYGLVYACDMVTWNPEENSFNDYPSYYDEDTRTFHFATKYYVSGGGFTYAGDETFVLGDKVSAPARSAMKQQNHIMKNSTVQWERRLKEPKASALM